MTDPASRALKQLRGGALPVLDAASETERRERIAARVLAVSRELSARQQQRRRVGWSLALAALVGGACSLLSWLSPGWGPATPTAGGASSATAAKCAWSPVTPTCATERASHPSPPAKTRCRRARCW